MQVLHSRIKDCFLTWTLDIVPLLGWQPISSMSLETQALLTTLLRPVSRRPSLSSKIQESSHRPVLLVVSLAPPKTTLSRSSRGDFTRKLRRSSTVESSCKLVSPVAKARYCKVQASLGRPRRSRANMSPRGTLRKENPRQTRLGTE
jgi:hypothetical protein